MIDSHCHLADPAFADDLEDVVRRAGEAGVSDGLCILSYGDTAEAAQAARLRALWPGLRFSIGVHPHQAQEFGGRFAELDGAMRVALSGTPGLAAIGEIGLDYHYDLSPREVQRDVFRSQIRLARDTGLPVVVHTRAADDDTIAIIREDGAGSVRGVFHCFSGSARLAQEALDLGFLRLLQIPGHAVESVRQQSEFIPAFYAYLMVQIPHARYPRAFGKRMDRLCESGG